MKKEEIDEIKDAIDNIFVRLEYLEKILARVKCSEESWKYNVLDLMEQVYDRLSYIRRKLDFLSTEDS